VDNNLCCPIPTVRNRLPRFFFSCFFSSTLKKKKPDDFYKLGIGFCLGVKFVTHRYLSDKHKALKHPTLEVTDIPYDQEAALVPMHSPGNQPVSYYDIGPPQKQEYSEEHHKDKKKKKKKNKNQDSNQHYPNYTS